MSDGNKWYVLRVISGKERKLKEYLDQHIKRLEWDTIVSQVLVPTEKVYKVKNKKVIQEKNSPPGYILIEAAEGKLTPK